jgi:hypothetical protein
MFVSVPAFPVVSYYETQAQDLGLIQELGSYPSVSQICVGCCQRNTISLLAFSLNPVGRLTPPPVTAKLCALKILPMTLPSETGNLLC